MYQLIFRMAISHLRQVMFVKTVHLRTYVNLLSNFIMELENSNNIDEKYYLQMYCHNHKVR